MKTKLDTARELIKEFCSEKFPELLNHDEFNAISTHFLMSPDERIPFLKETEQKDLYSHLLEKLTYTSSSECEDSVREGESQKTFDFVFDTIPFPPPENPKFTFIDLFAGIGGFRQAMQDNGGKCVFSSEWDKYAQQTYFRNYGEIPFGDIRKIETKDIPDHDILCGGFPCQPFSLAGVSKKKSMGRKHGFEDETQGTLFFNVAKIIADKRPKAFFLENVKNLLTHDKKRTFEVIRKTLEEELGYVVNWKIVDGANWVPQHRERLFIVGYDPKQINITKDEIIIPSKPSSDYKYPELKDIIQAEVDKKYTLGPGTWDTLERHKANHAKKGNGFGYGLHKWPIEKGTVTRTISARYHKDGAEILIEQPHRDRPRRLTVDEAKQLQGYDKEKFVFPVSNTQAYKQIGNSVVVPAIREVAKEIVKILKESL